MYLLDPDAGNRRRALLRDRFVRSANLAQEAVGTTWRDARNRAQGLAASLPSSLRRRPVDDRTLAERVRSRLGFTVRHPGSIDVTAENGRIILSGPVLRDEVDRLLAETGKVPGVTEVENRLEVHDEPGNVPGLQGEPSRVPRGRRFELLQVNWSPAARVIVGTAGASLVWYGTSQRTMQGRGVASQGWPWSHARWPTSNSRA